MGTAAVVLVIVFAVILVSLLVLAALKRQRTTSQAPPPALVHPHAPSYRPQAQHSEYYRPHEVKDGPSPAGDGHRTHGPRGEPLPHCPLCDAAVGFDDDKCPKCRHDLRRL